MEGCYQLFRIKVFPMQIPCTIHRLALAGFLFAFSIGHNTLNANAAFLNSIDETVLQQRVSQLELPVTPKYNATVREYIRRYVTSGHKDAEEMLGRSVIYFPIFEYYLNVYQLPQELKYLPIVESNLRPTVVSNAGATGLWQLMHSTASELGLSVSGSLDERRDPYKATEAAVRYLSTLYKRFGSWELALAAYNCGPGNVSKAVRLSGSTDFWKLREYLPSETRHYIPRFIAASYVVNHYRERSLLPERPEYDLQFTQTVKVFSELSFQKISSISRVPVSTIRALNPAYRQSYIPRSSGGNFLILPKMGMQAFKDYLKWSGYQTIKTDAPQIAAQAAPGASPFSPVTVTIESPGQTLASIAATYGCRTEVLMSWNSLSSRDLYFRQELVVYVPEGSPLALRNN